MKHLVIVEVEAVEEEWTLEQAKNFVSYALDDAHDVYREDPGITVWCGVVGDFDA